MVQLLDYYISLSTVLWIFWDCLYAMRFKICQMFCRNVKERRRWRSERFLGDIIYLRFNEVDAFFSKDKDSFISPNTDI